MGKLEGKVAVITGGSSGMALATAKLFVEEGAYVFITGRRQKALDEAVKLIGRNVTGVRGDAANLDDLDRLFETVKREKGKIDSRGGIGKNGSTRPHNGPVGSAAAITVHATSPRGLGFRSFDTGS
jgi:hypothetical protein